jgi:formate C-acetyltransferase
MLRGCIARNLPLEAGAAPYNLVGINILGLGTLVDSLHAVREVVFTHGELSLAALATAMAADFPDDALRERLRRLPGRYGTDDAATNALAREVSTRIARMVLDSRLDNGVRPYPGFFAFSADIYARGAATPDGRRRDDLISYGVGPAAIDSTPTAILAAAAHAAHALAACGNPLALTLARSDIAGPDGWRVIQHLVEAYFALGGSHLHVNVLTVDELRQAQANPAAHPGLTVRVSGYSARFVEVERTWQDALIARAARGL